MSKLAERLAVTAPPVARPAPPRHVEATTDTSPVLRAVWRLLMLVVVTGAAWMALSALTASFARQVAGL